MILSFLLLLTQADALHCNPDGNQQELNFCARDTYRAADRAMNAQWRRSLAAAKADSIVQAKPSPSDDNAPYASVLIAAQRAWLAYRDAQCRLESRSSQGGSMEPMVEFGCLARLTKERTAALRKLAEDK